MTGSRAARIAKADLILGRPLGDGGQGTVWEVEKRLINKTWPVAYKEYKPEALGQLRVDALERMVAFLPGRPAAVGRWLATNTAWPAALVTEGQAVRGFLMRQIPDEFFITMPSGDRKTAGFEFLLNSQDYVRRIVGTVSPRQMMGLLLSLADTLHRLHGLSVVAGDLSPKNLLFALSGPRPTCFLIDCDAMGLAGGWALPPVQTPGWGLPSGEAPGSPQGDVYKFALLAVRLFLHEQHGQDADALRRIDGPVGELAARALSTTPSGRPPLTDWLDPLRQACDTAPVTWPESVRHVAGPATGSTRPGTSRSGGVSPPGGFRTAAGTGGTGRAGGQGAAGQPTPAHVTPVVQPPQTQNSGGGRGCAVAVLVLLVLALIIWLNSSGDGSGGSTGSNGTSSSTSSGTGTGTAGAETAAVVAEQADALDELLADNTGRRSGVAEAVQWMTQCTKLSSARQVFTDAAEGREELVRRLDELTLDALPAGTASSLRTAWESSAEADWAYAQVVDDVSGGCTPGRVTGSGAWTDAAEASADATQAKKDFVDAWNPIARRHGLTTLAWTDL
ncbi:hypothetical protein ACPCTK_12045 [Streptomyces pseudogriseolus]|uniref:hypothetical protein n=1 Tax=Streptomyces pseudogriseolus TaxID=36817 RepID=UPI003FA24825